MTELHAGLELNALVAEEVMGWVRVSMYVRDGKLAWHLCDPAIAESMMEGKPEYHLALDGELPASDDWQRYAPAYSTDIAKAWLVHQVACSWIFSKRQRYFKMLQEEATLREGFLVAWPDVLVLLKDRMPEAICRAAIKTQRAPECAGENT